MRLSTIISTISSLSALVLFHEGDTSTEADATYHLFINCEAVDALTEKDDPGSLFNTNKDGKDNLLVMYYGNNCGYSQRCQPSFCEMAKE